jgi:signal transduction histidine kinase
MKTSTQPLCRYASLLHVFLRNHRKTITGTAFAGDGSLLFASSSLSSRIQAHEDVVSEYLVASMPAKAKVRLSKRAAQFFAHALASLKSPPKLILTIEALSQHIMAQAAKQHELQNALQVKEAALLLTQSEQFHYQQLLKKSETQQTQLRRLSRQLLTAQEDERRKISRELHDVIAQTLTGINIKLATLKKQSTSDLKKMLRSINSTQRLVEKSVAIVHQFACELRPSVIDVLGLIPALESLAHQFSVRTGIHTRVQSSTQLSQLDIAQRTSLFRVAEEALTNVARHSSATKVTIGLTHEETKVSMTIHDNGKSFCVLSVARHQNGKHLGLLGMRERIEMLNGTFLIESAPGHGTTISTSIPTATPVKRRAKSTTDL